MHYSPDLELKHMESQPESAAVVSGGSGTDDTTFIEGVVPSSFCSCG